MKRKRFIPATEALAKVIKLAKFGERVLRILESDTRWDPDTVLLIVDAAVSQNSAAIDDEGYFKPNIDQ